MKTESLMTTYDGDEIEVAWNPLTKRWERVYPESELGGEQPVTMYWCKPHGRYMTIPDRTERTTMTTTTTTENHPPPTPRWTPSPPRWTRG